MAASSWSELHRARPEHINDGLPDTLSRDQAALFKLCSKKPWSGDGRVQLRIFSTSSLLSILSCLGECGAPMQQL